MSPEWLKHPNAKALVTEADGAYGLEPSAGRALDALVAEKVMGWANVGMKQMHSLAGGNFGQPTTLVPDGEALRGNPPNAPDYAREQHVPDFSTTIAAAWLVVEHLLKQGMYPDVISTGNRSNTFWRCEIDSFSDPESPHDPWPIKVTKETAPLAICLAALKAVDARARASGSSDRE